MYGINTQDFKRLMRIKAYGKVNLGLDVVGQREDGYHLVRMIMQTVDVCDEIVLSIISESPDPSEPFFITVKCDNPDVPTDQSNLVYKAARLIADRYKLEGALEIAIEKNIPMAAGMAGGSADAAAVIKGMNELCKLKLSEKEMDEIALRLGADVPFCLRKGTYLSEGIGEVLTQVADLCSCIMVIIKPPIGVSTPWAYHALDEKMKEEPLPHPDIDGLIAALQEKDIHKVAAKLGNILELVTSRQYPVIEEIKNTLLDSGAIGALMSGSGPTVFGIFTEEKKADQALLNFEGRKYGQFKIKF